MQTDGEHMMDLWWMVISTIESIIIRVSFLIAETIIVNGIENLWSFAKRRLRKFNGIRARDFYLHLKECEFRYNEWSNIYKQMVQI
jgi:transposase-like protein